MPDSDKFKSKYQQLNSAQKEAVDAIEGPVMVIAGPGTGKTTILTLRIANILLKTDVQPENILALTFTEAGVYSMRKKLIDLIGNTGYRVQIHTFHSFCNEIIQKYPEYFPRIIGSQNLDDSTQIQIIENIIDTNNYENLKPYGERYFYVRNIISAIKDLKREGVSPEIFSDFLKEIESDLSDNPDYYNKKGELKSVHLSRSKKIKRSRELLDVYAKYESRLEEIKKYDYEDMILEVVKALKKDSEFLLILQEQYQYMLADEHQDANNAQNSILELLANFHDSPNLFIVGDEKQAIYRFQGASLNNFLYFKNRYKDTKLIILDQNYRSNQNILDNAFSLIDKNPIANEDLRQELRRELKGSKIKGVSIKVSVLEDKEQEHYYLAQKLQEDIKSGILAEDIAVLYRNNKDLSEILNYLEKTDLDFSIISDQNLFANADVYRFVTLLRSLLNLYDDESLAKVLHFDFINIKTQEVHEILHESYKSKTSVFKILQKNNSEIADLLNNMSEVVYNKPALKATEIILNQSGLIKDILSKEASYERLSVIDTFFNQVRKASENNFHLSIKDFLKYLDTLESYGVLIPIGKNKTKGISLMTAHKSKGLEFKKVYILGLEDKHWGNKGNREYFILPQDLSGLKKGDFGDDKNADERRLFYVAITRAKESVEILYSKANLDGKEVLPSIFISELLEGGYDMKEIPKMEFDQDKYKVLASNSNHDKEYLRQRFLNQSFSVTALNNFISCPWKYFFSNLIRLPQTPKNPQLYGTAIHDTLHFYFDKYREDTDVSEEEMLKFFEGRLNELPLESDDYEILLKKGREALPGFIKQETWQKQIMNEFKVSGIDFEFNFEGVDYKVTLNGVIDKMQFEDDDSVTVVDYKTGTPKSRNELMGKTQNSNGDYYRQLIFYKLLLDNFDDSKYRVKKGSIYFVEPTDRGVYKKEDFEITTELVDELKEEISKILAKIYSLSFWNEDCGDKSCEYCKLRKDLM